MKHDDFIARIDDEQVKAAIAQAEAGTSGQIRVFVSKRAWADPTGAAAAHFRVLKMDRTKERNGILIFMAPRSRTFAIYGDVAIHKQCGGAFWEGVRNEMEGDLKAGKYTEAVVGAVGRAGKLLATYFPAAGGGKKNELEDEVGRD